MDFELSFEELMAWYYGFVRNRLESAAPFPSRERHGTEPVLKTAGEEPTRREAALKNREEELARREKIAEEREANLAEREKALRVREQRLNDARRDAADAETAVQRRTETAEQMTALRADMTEAMRVIRLLPQLAQRVQQFSQKTNELQRAVEGSEYQEGFAKLARLCRFAEKAEGEDMRYAARRLAEIMTGEFGMTKLTPNSGERFDPDLHERINSDDRGPRIRACRACGWLRGEDVLLPAIVETEG